MLSVATLVAFSRTGQSRWLVPALVLVPDVSWSGYLAGTRIGAGIDNAAHATPLPAVVIGLGWRQHRSLVLALGLVWLAHIALHRLQGYGLKDDDSFQPTHLGMVGQGRQRR